MLFIFLVIFGMDFKCLVVSSYMTSKGWVKGGTVGSVEGGEPWSSAALRIFQFLREPYKQDSRYPTLR